MGEDAPTGVAPELVRLVRAELDAAGFPRRADRRLRRLHEARIRAFEAAGVPVDAYGVGSSLLRGANDFTADVVIVDGRPCAKVGRRFNPNPRLEPVLVRSAARRRSRRAIEVVVVADDDAPARTA